MIRTRGSVEWIRWKDPEDQAKILAHIDRCLQVDEERFRGDLMGWQL